MSSARILYRKSIFEPPLSDYFSFRIFFTTISKGLLGRASVFGRGSLYWLNLDETMVMIIVTANHQAPFMALCLNLF